MLLASETVLARPNPYATWLASNLSFIPGLLFIATLAAIAWVAFLKARLNWRIAVQNAWINRSVNIARERSRVLEIISSNHKLDHLLSEICASGVHLLPGTECHYNLQLD